MWSFSLIMIIKTSKCGDCPFVKMDYDDFSVGFDSSASCGVLQTL